MFRISSGIVSLFYHSVLPPVSFVFQSRNITAKVVQPHLSTGEVTRSRSVAIARQRESRSVKRGFELKCRSRAKLHFRNRHFFWPRRCTCPDRRGKSAVRYFSFEKISNGNRRTRRTQHETEASKTAERV